MKLILTHNHSDFDAVASQLAAARLYPGSFALLSDQLNRNVREYLALYREQLPLLHDDLPADAVIDELILVDTDSPPRQEWLEPLRRTTIIDHHSPCREPAPHERMLCEAVGATATILTRQLMAAHECLAPAEATLLLLAIYEDTGSLAFRGTTQDDLACAAWLMSQGARIDAIDEWLHRGLLPDQELVYHQLERSLRSLELGGWTLILSHAHVEGRAPELSTLAHKLRDLYDPVALLLAVQIGDNGTQLILRSNGEALDVGELARRYGGGGHAMAAAAFVRERRAEALLDEIAALLPGLVRPAATAATIMTTKVRVVRPDARVRDAEATLNRYGHGALPVVDGEGQVQGLIARRDVDRALRHGLQDAPVSKYMWREPPLVDPHTPLAQLRGILADEDSARVGRLLVVDERRHLLGLVTRSDLLRAWEQEAPRQRAPRHENLAERLARALAPEVLELLREAAAIADERGSALYIVGGVVRDMLLERSIGDLDLVVEGDAVAVGAELAARHGGSLRSHSQFGTASVQIPSPALELDFVTARTEYYEEPSALPQVEPASLRHDLHRRDFTINTLALCLSPARYGWLYDFYGGRRDLRKRYIRVLHNLSFIDDPTRLLRAARLAARLGFDVEPRTRALIGDAVEQDLLSRTTPARVTHELRLLLAEELPERAVALLDELGLLHALHPELRWSPRLAERFMAARALQHDGHQDRLYIGVLTYHLSEAGREQLITRYQLGAALSRLLQDLSALRRVLPRIADPSIAPSALDLALQPLSDTALLVGLLMEEGTPAAAAIARYRHELRPRATRLGGRDLLAMGVQSGPQVGALLAGLRAAMLDGTLRDAAEERAWVRQELSG